MIILNLLLEVLESFEELTVSLTESCFYLIILIDHGANLCAKHLILLLDSFIAPMRFHFMMMFMRSADLILQVIDLLFKLDNSLSLASSLRRAPFPLAHMLSHQVTHFCNLLLHILHLSLMLDSFLLLLFLQLSNLSCKSKLLG